MKGIFGLWIVLAASCVPASAASQDAILAAFDRYDVVAIADQRGVVELANLLTAVVTADAFSTRGIDLVVDFAGSTHQKTVEAYVAGDRVADAALRSAINAAPVFASGGAPRSYDALFAAIRKANTGRPAARRVKVWLPAAEVAGSITPLAARVRERLEAGRKVLLVADALELAGGGMRVMRMAGGPWLESRAAAGAEAQSPPGPGVSPEGGPEQSGRRVIIGGPGEAPGAGEGFTVPPSTIQTVREARPGRVLTLFPWCGLDDAAAGDRVESAIAPAGVGFITPLGTGAVAEVLRSSLGRDLAGGMAVGPLIAEADGLVYLGPVQSLTLAPVRLSEAPQRVVDVAARRPKDTGPTFFQNRVEVQRAP